MEIHQKRETMGTYLAVRIVTEMRIDRKEADMKKADITILSSSLRENLINLDHYLYQENDANH